MLRPMLAGPVADPTLGVRSAHIFETLFGLRDGGRVGPGVVVEPQTRYALLEPRKIWYTIEGPLGEVRLPPVMLLLEEKRHRPVVLLHVVPSSFTVLVVVQPDDAQEKSPIVFRARCATSCWTARRSPYYTSEDPEL